MRKILLYSVMGLILLSCQKEKVNPGIIDPPEEEIILGNPVITTISPIQGGPLSVFTITGDNFSAKKEENEVTINGVTARIISVNKTTIQVEVPENAETGPVTVRVVSKTVTGPEFTILRIPVYVYISETFAGSGVKGYQDGNPASAQFNLPEGVDMDSKGNIFVADRDNQIIRKITPAGEVSTIAGVVGEKGANDGGFGVAKFFSPLKVAVDAQDNIYVTDRDNQKIRKIDAVTGMVTTVAGDGTKGFKDGPAAEAQFSNPIDVAVAADGTIYVSESGNHRIRKISTNGTVSTLAGNGSGGYKDGIGTEAQLNDPSGVTIDKDGNLLIADRRNHRVRKITPAGVVTTIAGGSAGYTDGTSESARFSHPWGISAGKDGAIYVADAGNNVIRMMSPEGIWTTIGGDSGRTAGHVDGTSSKYDYPTDLVVDNKTGNIYVAGYNNQAIRRIVRTEK